MNFFRSKPKESVAPEVSVCMSTNDSIMVIHLSDVLEMTNKDELRKLARRIFNHVAQSFDEEECTNGSILLEEIEKKLSAQ